MNVTYILELSRCNEGRNFSNTEKQYVDCSQTKERHESNWSEMGVSGKEGQHEKDCETHSKVGSKRTC